MHLLPAEVIIVMDSILSAYSTFAVLGIFAAIIGALVTAAVDSTPKATHP